ncbi:MAG: hypothetical protein IKL84_00375 [Clostridia bacterium]|nr:hypothetical protein [Clostridia bacterium]
MLVRLYFSDVDLPFHMLWRLPHFDNPSTHSQPNPNPFSTRRHFSPQSVLWIAEEYAVEKKSTPHLSHTTRKSFHSRPPDYPHRNLLIGLRKAGIFRGFDLFHSFYTPY